MEQSECITETWSTNICKTETYMWQVERIIYYEPVVQSRSLNGSRYALLEVKCLNLLVNVSYLCLTWTTYIRKISECHLKGVCNKFC